MNNNTINFTLKTTMFLKSHNTVTQKGNLSVQMSVQPFAKALIKKLMTPQANSDNI